MTDAKTPTSPPTSLQRFFDAVDAYLDGEAVRTQPGRFYGGWITAEVVGPFKGEPGTGHW